LEWHVIWSYPLANEATRIETCVLTQNCTKIQHHPFACGIHLALFDFLKL
jgi:hypothetical protein